MWKIYLAKNVESKPRVHIRLGISAGGDCGSLNKQKAKR